MDLLDDDSVLDLRPRGRRTDPAAFVDQERRRAPALPSQNAPLREWGSGPAPPTPPAPAEDLGTCARCGVRPARSRCAQCGQAVCGPDAWSMLGLCRACLASSVSAQA